MRGKMMHSLYGGLGADPLATAAAMAAMDPLLAAKDTTFTKIFVGGLPYHTTDKTLREYFEQFGDIEEAVVITDRQTGKSRGYGFVTMKERGGAERACKDPNPIIDGRKANVNLAYLGAKPRANLQLNGLPLPLQTAAVSLPALLNPAARLGLSQLYYPTAGAAQATPIMTSQGLMMSPLSATGAYGGAGAGAGMGMGGGGSAGAEYASALLSAYAASAGQPQLQAVYEQALLQLYAEGGCWQAGYGAYLGQGAGGANAGAAAAAALYAANPTVSAAYAANPAAAAVAAAAYSQAASLSAAGQDRVQ